jgi:subtilase family serine protease
MNVTLRFRVLSAAVIASVGIAACSGGGSSSTPISPIPAASAAPSTASSGASAGLSYGGGLLAGATLVKRASLASVGADVLVSMRDATGLIAYAKAASDPGNPAFRHWLTPQQLGDRFGAPAADYEAAQKYLVANGIGVMSYPQRQMLRIHGPQANVERALGVQFGIYTKNGQTFIAPEGVPHPASVLHASAIGNVVRYRVRTRRFLPLRVSSALVEGYSPQQIAGGFDFNGAYAAGYKGDGMTIGIIGTGPITDGDPRLSLGDAAETRTLFKVGGSGSVVQDVDLSNYSPGDGSSGPTQYSQTGLATPPPVTAPNAPGCPAGNSLSNPLPISNYQTCNPEDIEAQLDTEQSAMLAPDATVNFYIAYNPDECYGTCSAQNTPSQAEGIEEADDEIEQAIADDKSDVISISFGEDELSSEEAGYFGVGGSPGFEPVEFASLASEGTAVFAAAGDDGAEACEDDSSLSTSQQNEPCVNYPATDPSVISVGGVNVPLDDSGRLTGPMTGWGEATEEVAPEQPAGSGGGCSAYFSIPSYESGITLPCGGKRPQPDAALDADTNTGVAVVVDAASGLGGGQIFPVGGTSAATPEMSAMWALVLQACKASAGCASHGSGAKPYRLGNPGTYLYKIYQNSSQYPVTFYDVLFGNNSAEGTSGSSQDPGYTAGKGYDEVTGLGAPYGGNLISSVLANVP